MGECGCNETNPYKIIRIGNKILVIEVYKGCHYCHTGIMVSIHIMSLKEAKDYMYEVTDDYSSSTYEIINIPIIDVDKLKASIEKLDGDNKIESYGNIGNWLDEEGLEILQEGVNLCLAEAWDERSK